MRSRSRSNDRPVSTKLPIGLAIGWVLVSLANCARGTDPNLDVGNGGGDGSDLVTDAAHDGSTDTPTMMMCSGGCSLPHANAMCIAGTCMVSHCDPGYADLNHMSGDGCECMIGSISNQCGMATDQGTINVGSMHTVTGVVAGPGMDQWIRVTFAPSGHPHVTLSSNPDMLLHFDVVNACTPNSMMMCMDRPLGSTGLTDWEFFDTPGDGGVQGDADGPMRMTPQPGSAYVRIYASAVPSGCSPYMLTISN